ncbi:Sensor protein RstB [Halioglobus japonicus]|nr:Sensor protein RstB [Halioglobus japonicus]
MTRARWIFLRAYLLVASLVVVTGLGLEALLVERDHQALIQREAALIEGAFLYSETLLDSTAAVDTVDLGQRLEQELALPSKLYRVEDFAVLEEGYEQLAAGETVQMYDTDDRPVFYRRLNNSPWVLALGPAPALDNERAKWVVPLFYALIAVAVYLWIRPLTKDLELLRESAQAFGQQDFSSRVSLPQGSWLAPLADAFNSMAQRIQWLLQSHRELTHAVSHELRTPLARLRFSLEMLAGAEAADRQRFRDAMNRDIEELNALVEEMLGYAELEQDNLTPQLEPLHLASWLTAYADYYNSHAPAITLTVASLPKGCIIPADERMLTRALDNLVGNAQRFARSRIQLNARVADGVCHLHVLDDGPGIPQEQREAVLSAYVRLGDNGNETRKGFGLGLAIVKRIVELHRGDVTIAEAAGGGADISMDIPL